jgi:hypothetical protein
MGLHRSLGEQQPLRDHPVGEALRNKPGDLLLPRGLLRARAIEDQGFVVAAAQIGDDEPNRTCYGRSMIVDPWGTVIAQVLDINCVSGPNSSWRGWRRAELPSLRNRRV